MLYDDAGRCGILFCACLTHWCLDCDTSASQLHPKELSRLLSLQQLPELLKTLKDCRKQTIYLLTIHCFICFFCFWRFLLILSVDLCSGWHRLTSILSSSFHLRMQQAKVSPRSLEVLHLYMMIVYSCFKSKLQYSIHELYTYFGQTWWFLATSTLIYLLQAWLTDSQRQRQAFAQGSSAPAALGHLSSLAQIPRFAWHFCNVISVPFRLQTTSIMCIYHHATSCILSDIAKELSTDFTILSDQSAVFPDRTNHCRLFSTSHRFRNTTALSDKSLCFSTSFPSSLLEI